MIRALKITGVVLGALLVLTGAAFSWVWWTQSGTRFALARIEGFLPEGFDLGTAHGSLSHHVQLTGVQVDLGTARVSLARLWLDWSPGELLRGRLHIDELGGRGVRYRMLPGPTEPASESAGLPEQVSLPIAVAVDRLTLEDVAVSTSPDADPLEVNEATVAGVTFHDSRLNVAALKAHGPHFSVDADAGALSLTAAGDYPVAAHLTWQLDLPGYAPASGTTRLDGSLATLQIEQTVAPPYRTELAATVSHLLDGDQPMTVDGHLNMKSLNLAAVKPDLPAATVGADVQVNGPLDNLDVSGILNGTDPQSRRLVANLQARVTSEAIDVQQLTLAQPDRQGRLSGQGRIALAQNVNADLALQWNDLRWPLTGEATIVIPEGKATLQGPLDDYRLALQTRLEPASAPAATLHVTGTGSLKQISLALTASTGSGNADGHADVRWDPAIAANVRLDAKDIDPSVLAPGWPGQVNLQLTASAAMKGQALDVTVSRLEAGGRLRDQDLSASARLHFQQGDPWPTVDVDKLTAALGKSSIDVQGRFAERADLRWKLTSHDLSAVVPQARGRISGSGTVSGPLPRVDVTTTLQGGDLEYGGNRLTHLDVNADLDLSGDTASRLDVTARDGSVAGSAVSRVSLTGSGRPQSHRLELTADGEPGHVELALQGHAPDPFGDHPVWNFELAKGELGYSGLAPWQLVAGARGTVASDRMSLSRQCWQADDARVCLQAHKDANGLGADVALTDLAFAYFAPLLPEGVDATGSINGTVQLSEPDGGALTGQVGLHTTAGQITLPPPDPDAGAQPPVVGLEPSSLNVQLTPSEIDGRVAVNLTHARLNLQATTSAALVVGRQSANAAPSVSDQALTGQVHLEVPELGFLGPMLPTLEDIEGSMRGDMTVSGTLGAPTLGGELNLRDGAVSVPAAGLDVRAMTATIRGQGRQVALQASAKSGGGNLDVSGRLALPGQAPTGTLDVQGKAFQVMNTDEARVFVSPDLVIDAKPDRLTVNGEVTVPKANVSPGKHPPSAVTVSEDQVLVSRQPAAESATARALYAKVRLILGDDVHFKGYGLTARIEGNVLVDQQPEKPATASGELDIVDGEYRAYGQGLVIDKGRIYFAGGPVTEPALDIRAVRHPKEDITVGAHVKGTLKSPSFELFSDPSMTQQEQLSYLVLGRSLEESPDGQQSALSSAMLAMGLKGGDFLAKNIGKAVGLDQFSIETGSGEAGAQSNPSEAQLVLGKYLSPRLYVSYGIGLFSPESVLRMQYDISNNWKVVTDSGSQSTGADILYTVELGKGESTGDRGDTGDTSDAGKLGETEASGEGS